MSCIFFPKRALESCPWNAKKKQLELVRTRVLQFFLTYDFSTWNAGGLWYWVLPHHSAVMLKSSGRPRVAPQIVLTYNTWRIIGEKTYLIFVYAFSRFICFLFLYAVLRIRIRSDPDLFAGSGFWNFTTKSGSGSSSGRFLKNICFCAISCICIFIYSVDVIHRLG